MDRTLPLLVVSPHFDDAVLSAFDLITRPGATVMTVFTSGPTVTTKTKWDQACGFPDSAEAMATRRREDDAAFDGIAGQRVFLGLNEGQYRDGRPLDEDVAILVDAVRSWTSEHPGCTVALPVGAGGPVTLLHRIRYKVPMHRIGLCGGSEPSSEHVWVRDRLLDALDSGTGLCLYEELPYLWVRRGDAEASRAAQRLNLTAKVTNTFVHLAAKAARIECYSSQRGVIFAPWMRLPDHLPATERTWTLEPAESEARRERMWSGH